jgi:molecular chaperone DnaK (HSP70)
LVTQASADLNKVKEFLGKKNAENAISPMESLIENLQRATENASRESQSILSKITNYCFDLSQCINSNSQTDYVKAKDIQSKIEALLHGELEKLMGSSK